MIASVLNSQSAVVPARVLILDQYPEPLPSGLGSTAVMPLQHAFLQDSATVKQDAFLLSQYPPPRPMALEPDLPGGFEKEAIISGEANPMSDLAHGIVQIDGVKVLFDAKA